MTASFVLALLSLTSRITGEEFVYAGGSIAAVMLASIFRGKRRAKHSRNHHPSATPNWGSKRLPDSKVDIAGISKGNERPFSC